MNATAIALITAGLATLAVTVESVKSTVPALLAEKTVESTATTSITTITNKSSGGSLKLKELNLSGSRQVYITGVIEENASLIARQILTLGKSSEPINVIINSPGGSVVDGASIISAIEAVRGPVNTVCVQLCASMAAMIHSYGTNRLMVNRSLIMFHPASGMVMGEVDKMYSRLGTLKRYVSKMELNAAKRAHMGYDEYKFRSGVEMWLDAEDAVNSGFADQVVFVRGLDSEKLYLDSPEGLRSSTHTGKILPSDPITLPVFNPATFHFDWL